MIIIQFICSVQSLIDYQVILAHPINFTRLSAHHYYSCQTYFFIFLFSFEQSENIIASTFHLIAIFIKFKHFRARHDPEACLEVKNARSFFTSNHTL
jgi:hypothetical protein